MQKAISIFQQIQYQWAANSNNIPEDFTPFGLPHVKKIDITKYLEEQIAFLQEDNLFGKVFDNFDRQYIYNEINVEGNLPNFISWFANIPGNAAGHIPPIVSTLQSWRSTLIQRNMFSVTKKVSDEERLAVKVLYDQAITLKTEKNQVDTLHKELTDMRNRSLELATTLERSVETVRLRRDETEVLAGKIASTSSDLNDLTIKTNVSLGAITESIGHLDKKREDLDRLHDELGSAAKNSIEQATLIENTLAAANRVGLAKAFENRRKDLDMPLYIWGGIFLAAIAGLCSLGGFVIFPNLIGRNGANLYEHLLIELPMTIPLIWLGYFSGSRYSYIEKVREDYAFKEATALSFEGFKTETSNIDRELLSQLLSISIENFGQNPIRLYDKKNSISPTSDALNSEIIKSITDKVLDKIPTVEKLAEFFMRKPS
ncbi:hypothetical protein [Janthinobacterium sp. NKUCC06_STL]|uniref:hypothetical protein n=1 Tax=Janthinobacterium sp. NKUCC06_STL TaxID=2842127 RepID=UPI001C5AC14C|nr:hypothetical protein [Janthinobacterium sp. NKUCC06_STL]MBW3507913.1 hypothetical protein [Janthinobacterium sp. NKUCC06_STL]